MSQSQNNTKSKEEYKLVMILKYFKLVKESYSYNELMDLFGLNIKQLDSLLFEMIQLRLLEVNQYIKITTSGEDLLKKYNINDYEQIDSYIETDIFNYERIEFEDIYIPKGFEKKFKK